MQINNQRAFTLVEIILVTVLLAVLAGIAIPNFSGSFRHLQLRDTSDTLLYWMRYAQGRAITKNSLVRLTFNEEKTQYTLDEKLPPEEDDTVVDEDWHPLKGRFKSEKKIPAKIRIEADISQIYFYHDGTVDKVRFWVCQQTQCYTISTKEQRGTINLFDAKIED